MKEFISAYIALFTACLKIYFKTIGVLLLMLVAIFIYLLIFKRKKK